MHIQRSKRSLRLLRRGAYHFLFNTVLGFAAVGAVAWSAYHYDLKLLYGSLGLVGLWLVSAVVFMVRGSRLRCSMCVMPLWSGSKCQKHKTVKPALGVSYRLGVALAVIFTGKYRCPYCGEIFSAR